METYAGIPRERIAWYPTIDSTRCHPDRCDLGCVSWCQKGVYRQEADGRVIVAQPFACTVGHLVRPAVPV